MLPVHHHRTSHQTSAEKSPSRGSAGKAVCPAQTLFASCADPSAQIACRLQNPRFLLIHALPRCSPRERTERCPRGIRPLSRCCAATAGAARAASTTTTAAQCPGDGGRAAPTRSRHPWGHHRAPLPRLHPLPTEKAGMPPKRLHGDTSAFPSRLPSVLDEMPQVPLGRQTILRLQHVLNKQFLKLTMPCFILLLIFF